MAYKRTACEEAAYYLGPRKRTEREVRDHLKDKGYSDEEIAQAAAYLKECRYIDDYDYALCYAEISYGKGRASKRIISELEQKGIDGETARMALEDYRYENSIDERELAVRQAGKLMESERIESEEDYRKVRGRLARRLDSRGFSASDIMAVLDALMREEWD